MRGFELYNGDLVIVNNEISMVDGNKLKSQTIQSVLSTNKGEWIFNKDEGIDFNAILGEKRVKLRNSTDTVLQKEYAAIKKNESGLADKLGRRLDGK